MKKPLEIRYVDPATLKPAERNPRIMPPAEMEALQRALDRWGFVDPIVVRAQDKRIIGGHQRVEAAVAMGMTEIPVVYVNVSKVDAMVLNEALNRITGRWNEAELALHQFDATPGHLPLPLMAQLATALAAALGVLGLGPYLVPTGSGETLLALRWAYPRTEFVAVYDCGVGTEYEEEAPLNRLVAAAGPVTRQAAAQTSAAAGGPCASLP